MRVLLNKLLRRESPQLISNREYLLKRQKSQLCLLEPLKDKIDQPLLKLNIRELISMQKQEVFNTFTCRNLSKSIKQLNGLADINISRALQKNPCGIPFTVKDHLKVEGMIQTCGFSKNIKESVETSQVVQILQNEGCVAYAHTNTPQGLLGISSANRLYGKASNPYDKRFIAGGSSGGDAVMVATQAAAFGFCSDSAGSVRIPAAFCGVYGFKPTGSKRLSIKGRVGVYGTVGPSIPGIDTATGFITRSVDDIAWLCEKTLGKTVNNNPMVYGLWNQQLYNKSLTTKKRFGLIYDSPQIQLAPAVKNVLYETVQLLKKQGHEVVEFKFPQLHKFRNFFFKVLNNVGFLTAMRNRVEGQFIMPQNQTMLNRFNASYIGRKVRVLTAQSQLQRQKFQLYDIGSSTAQLMGLLKQRDYYQQEFHKQWSRLNLDLLLSPTMPFTAPLHQCSAQSIHQLTFTAFQNVLQLPAGHVPVRLVQNSQTIYQDKRLYASQIRRSIERSVGLPVGVQFTGRHMRDQECVAAMFQIEKAMNKSINLPSIN